MSAGAGRGTVRCAIYTRKSSEEGLKQDFNSLDAQREACAAYVLNQASEGWKLVDAHYDDGGISGGTLERPALQRLLEDVKERKVDIIVVYKVDRLTRSLLDFAKLVEAFDKANVCFVSVTQSFNTTTSMGRLTLNMLLSFAQFEREVTVERIRDKIAQSKARGMWMGGLPPLGYEPDGRNGLSIVGDHAAVVRDIFRRYLNLGNVRHVAQALETERVASPMRTTRKGKAYGECRFTRGQIYHILKNPIYAGDIAHKGAVYPGNHQAIIRREEWDAVQQKLAAHVRGVRKAREASAALLAGILFDHTDQALIPVHTSKPCPDGGQDARKRYRYYVSKGVHHDASASSAQSIRIPAEEIEQAVRSQLAKILADPYALIEQTKLDVPPVRYKQVTASILALHHQVLGGGKRLEKTLLARVAVYPGQLELVIDIEALAKELEIVSRPGASPTLTQQSSVSLTRTGHTLRLVDARGCLASTRADPALTGLLAQAHQWWAELVRGELDIAKLSRRENVSASWMTRVVRLALLAPEVTEVILDGKQRAVIDAATILKPGAIDPDWSKQARSMLAQG